MINKPLALGQRWHILYFSILAALFLLFFWPLFSTSHALLKGDYGAQVYPWLHTYAAAIKNGSLPLWTDKIQCGFPLFAEGQTAMLYLPQLILFKLLSFKFAYNALFVGHYVFSGLFFYLFCRNNRISVSASILVAMAYLFGSLSAGGFYGFFSLRPLLWFPLSLLCADKMIEKRSRAAFFILLFSQSQMWVAGYPQMAAYASFFLVLYAAAKGFSAKAPLKLYGWIVAAIFLSMVMTLVQILPTLQLGAHSTRLLQDKDFFLWGSLDPWALVGLWMYQLSSFFGSNLYLGIFPLLLIVALARLRDLKLWWVLAGIAAFLALGRWNPLFGLLSNTGALSLLRAPSKLMFFCLFFLLIIAAKTFDRIFTDPSGEGAKKSVKRVSIVLIVFSVFYMAVVAFIQMASQRIISFGNWYVEKFVLGKSFHRKSALEYQDKVKALFENLQGCLSWDSHFFLLSLSIAIAALLILYFFLLKKRRLVLCISLLLCLCAADFWIYGVKTPGTSWVGNVGAYAALPDFRGYPTDDRYLEISSGEATALFPPNSNMSAEFAQVGAYSPLLDKTYYVLAKGLAVLDDSFGAAYFEQEISKNSKPLVDFMGVRYIISDRGDAAPWEGLMPGVQIQRNCTLYLNPDAMSQLNFVWAVKTIVDENERITYLRSAEFDGRREVVLAQAPLGFSAQEASVEKINSIVSTDLGAQMKDAEVQAPSRGFLVWNQTFDPGWKVWVDGLPASILRANQAFMAIRLEPGSHQVKFRYLPLFFIPGICLYGAGVVICLLGAVYFGVREKFQHG